MRGAAGVAVEFGGAGAAAPDEVGRHADDGVAAAGGAVFDAFEQEGVGAAGGELHVGGDRGFEIGDVFGPDEGAAAFVVGGEAGGLGGRGDGVHWLRLSKSWRLTVGWSRSRRATAKVSSMSWATALLRAVWSWAAPAGSVSGAGAATETSLAT